MEPICAEVFPGNSIDASSYPAFIRDNDIRRGIIVADKGFPPGQIKTGLSERHPKRKRPILYSKDTKAMNALATQENKGISR